MAACLRCHNDRGAVERYVARGCSGCHSDPHKGSLSLDCTRCHDEESWQPHGLVSEHFQTSFPLTGVHVSVACEQCHERASVGDYVGAPNECHLCHQEDLAQTISPNHIDMGLTTNCQDCHITSTFLEATLDHSSFPLIGGHALAAADCTKCHDSGVLAGLATDCVSCHQQDYSDTTAPNHVQAGFPTDCEVCHTITSWQGAVFDHSAFPLEGGHASVDCTQCHTGNVFAGLASDCVSCHQTDFDNAEPNHVAAGFATTCDDCHTINTWEGATIDHSIFALTGGHAGVRLYPMSYRDRICWTTSGLRQLSSG